MGVALLVLPLVPVAAAGGAGSPRQADIRAIDRDIRAIRADYARMKRMYEAASHRYDEIQTTLRACVRAGSHANATRCQAASEAGAHDYPLVQRAWRIAGRGFAVLESACPCHLKVLRTLGKLKLSALEAWLTKEKAALLKERKLSIFESNAAVAVRG